MSKLILYLLIFLILCFETLDCQTRRPSSNQRRKSNRNRNRVRGRGRQPEPVDQRLNCYSCYVDFTIEKFRVNNLCYNPAYNWTLADQEHLTKCPRQSKFCTVDITRVNGGLGIVDRRCGGTTCKYYCISKGYGVERETCTYCCSGKPNDDDEDFDEEAREKYKACPVGA